MQVDASDVQLLAGSVTDGALSYTAERSFADNALSADPNIVNKYRMAADACARGISAVFSGVCPGASVRALCELGDGIVAAETAKLFRKATVEKGVAQPTTISVNGIASGYAPTTDATDRVLVVGDVVKIDIGAHVDGYIASAAHTMIVVDNGSPATACVQGPSADCICAAYYASELVHRMLRPGTTSTEILAVVQQVADAFGVQLVDGVLLTEVRRFLSSSPVKTLYGGMDDATALDHQFSIGHDETYTVNVIMTTGVKEHVRESDNKSPTLFYRNLDEQAPQSGQQRAPYVPKMKNARQTMVQLMDAYGVFPFNVRSLTLKQRLGFQECVKHGLYHGVPVMEAKRGDVTAQFKFTVAISGARSEAVRITNAGLPLPYVHSSMELPVELQTLMKVSAKVVKAARVVPGAGAMEVDA